MNGTDPLPHNYSLSSDEVVVVDVSLNTSLDQLKVVIYRCWATSTQNPGDTHSYTFLENRSAWSSRSHCCHLLTRKSQKEVTLCVELLHSCSLNKYTKVLTNGNSSTSRVSVQLFSFVDLSVVYLHCQVLICAQMGSDSCAPVRTPTTPLEGRPPSFMVHDSAHSWTLSFSLGLLATNISIFGQRDRNRFWFCGASAEVQRRYRLHHAERTCSGVFLLLIIAPGCNMFSQKP